MRDVTARKAAETKAKEAETRLVEAIEALPDGFVLYDAEDRLVLCNEHYREIYRTSSDLIVPGTTFEEIVRKGAERGQYSEAIDDVDAWVAKRLAAHRNPGASVEQKLDDGRWLRIIERRTESGFTVGFRVDITALKEREQALRQSQDLLGATVKAALDAIIVIDHHGKIIRFNPAAESIFGYSSKQAIGRDMADLIIPSKYRSAHRQGLQQYLKTLEGAVIGKRIEIEALRSDGQEINVELVVQPSAGPEGPVFIGYLRDITDEKQRQQALIEARDKAEDAGRAKAAFLAMMSHEIRTPLNGVLGILNLLQDTKLEDGQRDYVKTAYESGTALLTIINDILDFSKLEAGQMVLEEGAFRVEQLLSDVARIIEPLAQKKKIQLTTHVAASTPIACKGDAGRLRQILLNLCANAVKFTTTGTVTMAIASTTAAGSDHAELTFTVTDTGVGIPEDKQKLIFSKFTTLDPGAGGKLGGTGLGLAISKAITEAMGGSIGYASTLGVGSSFWFTVTLPIVDPSQVQSNDEPVRKPELSRRLRILLAEDNATNQLVVTKMLEAAGCTVDTAANGQEALEAATQRSYDVIFMDVAMPEMDGLTATRRIRDLPSPACDTPIIALTAYALAEDKERCRKAGMGSVLTKPIARAGLYKTLESVATVAAPTTSYKQSDATPIEIGVFDELFEGEPKSVKQMAMSQFLADITEQRDRLASGMAQQNLHAIERSSHVLIGLAGTFGASRAAGLARETNTLARREKTQQALAAGRSLSEECQALLNYLASPSLQ